jgi:hypothetical protein
MTRVLAVTTSLGTRWESYSQALISQSFPHWERLIVDGRKGWTPAGFIAHALRGDSDFVVHVDEDCFMLSREAMDEILARFANDPSLVAAGVPDGGHYYRELNPAALNLFFVVFRTSALRAAWEARDHWDQVAFHPADGDDVRRQVPDLDAQRVHWDRSEPYYPLFWSLLRAGGRFLYLPHGLNRERWSTLVHAPSGAVAAEHLWYLREWKSDRTQPGHDCPNINRYRALERSLLERPDTGMRFRALFGALSARRLIRKAFT